ncbi:MAG: protein phosphatase 2C domain-containing protein [archaeon]|nr:protein phosphatase 2C domain-containing protein [archaeon]
MNGKLKVAKDNKPVKISTDMKMKIDKNKDMPLNKKIMNPVKLGDKIDNETKEKWLQKMKAQHKLNPHENKRGENKIEGNLQPQKFKIAPKNIIMKDQEETEKNRPKITAHQRGKKIIIKNHDSKGGFSKPILFPKIAVKESNEVNLAKQMPNKLKVNKEGSKPLFVKNQIVGNKIHQPMKNIKIAKQEKSPLIIQNKGQGPVKAFEFEKPLQPTEQPFFGTFGKINENEEPNKLKESLKKSLKKEDKLKESIKSNDSENIDIHQSINFGGQNKIKGGAHIKKIIIHGRDIKSDATNKKYINPQNKMPYSSEDKIIRIREHSYIADQNKECREEMEDFAYINLDLLPKQMKVSYFGLYDGFEGSSVVLKVQKDLHKIIGKKLLNKAENVLIEHVLIESFYEIEEDIKKDEASFHCGTTATVALILNNYLYVANVGNSTAYLIENNNRVVRVSKDHDCKDQKEIARIKQHEGKIINGRVFASLSLTRCLGDTDYKDYGVICRPSVSKTQLFSGNQYTLVIASDGVWDALTPDNILGYIKSDTKISADDLNKRILKDSLVGSRDNISCIIVKIS